VGVGRLADPERILSALSQLLSEIPPKAE